MEKKEVKLFRFFSFNFVPQTPDKGKKELRIFTPCAPTVPNFPSVEGSLWPCEAASCPQLLLCFCWQALEEALQERELIQDRFEKEFETIRTMSSSKEQQMMEDFEWKLREIEREYKRKMEEKDREAEEKWVQSRYLLKYFKSLT